MEVGLLPGDFVLSDAAPIKRRHSPQFSARVYCVQTVAHLSYCWALVLLFTAYHIHIVFSYVCAMHIRRRLTLVRRSCVRVQLSHHRIAAPRCFQRKPEMPAVYRNNKTIVHSIRLPRCAL